jgi:adenosine deaminase
MKLKKSDEIIKIEEALKKAKLKQKENIKKINLEFTETILNKLKEDDNFKNDLKNLLSKYSLNNSIDLLNKNYGAFEIKQKNEETKKEEN